MCDVSATLDVTNIHLGGDDELARWAALEVLPGLADVSQPGPLQIQGEPALDRVTHQLRVAGAAHLGGRGGHTLTHQGDHLVAQSGRADHRPGPSGAPDLDVP